MDDYTAALRITRTDDSPALFAAGSIGTLQGVRHATVDKLTGQVIIRYDRARITIGDLVRWIEDQGLQVVSVAQQCEAAATAQTATA
jgi:hypothetical protein